MGKVDFLEYDHKTCYRVDKYQNKVVGTVDNNSDRSIVGRLVRIENSPNYSRGIVDIDTSDRKFNPVTGRWSGKGPNPTLTDLVYQLENNLHPHATIGLYSKPGGFVDYLIAQLGENANPKQKKGEIDHITVNDNELGCKRFTRLITVGNIDVDIKDPNKTRRIQTLWTSLLNAGGIAQQKRGLFEQLAGNARARNNERQIKQRFVETPELEKEKIQALLKQSTDNLASSLEFEDNREMLAEIRESLSIFPGLNILYLRKRIHHVTGYPHGAYGTKTCWPNGTKIPPTKCEFFNNHGYHHFARGSAACVFFGESWLIQIGFDFTGQVFDLHWCTPEQYIAGVKPGRPDLVDDKFEPWAPHMFLSQNFYCERNGPWAKAQGHLDMSDPHTRRISLEMYIGTIIMNKLSVSGSLGENNKNIQVTRPKGILGLSKPGKFAQFIADKAANKED